MYTLLIKLLSTCLTIGFTSVYVWHFMENGAIKPLMYLSVCIYLILLFLLNTAEYSLKSYNINWTKHKANLDKYFKYILLTTMFTIIFYLLRTLDNSFGFYFN